mgnify:FL=1
MSKHTPELPCSGCGMVYPNKPSSTPWACDKCLEESANSEQEAELLDACKQFEPILAWLEHLADESVGCNLSKQLRPVMQAAIKKVEGAE